MEGITEKRQLMKKIEAQRSGFKSTNEGMCQKEGKPVFLCEGRKRLEGGRDGRRIGKAQVGETLYREKCKVSCRKL